MNIRTFGNQKESQVIEPETRVGVTLRYEFEYDTQHPEEKVKGFVMDVKGMISKYNQNVERIKEIENEMSDLEHYMEVTSYKTVPEGYKLYRKLASLRRERRACKSENDLLRPVCEYFRSTNVLDKLSNVQGDVAKAQSLVDTRVYTVRTDVLDEFIKDKKDDKKDVDTENIVELPSIEEAYAK